MARRNDVNTALFVLAAVLVVAVLFVILTQRPQGAQAGQQAQQSYFNQSTAAVSGCESASGFLCLALGYNAATGNLTFGVVQDTPSNWTITVIKFLPAGTQYVEEIPQTSWNGSTAVNGTFVHGIEYRFTLPATGRVATGTALSGQIWAKFQIEAGGDVYYTRLATINVTAR